MLEFLFKFKESTSRGRLLKNILKDTNLGSSDPPIPLSNTCEVCSKDVIPVDVIDCPICKEKYHIPCLTYTISADFVTHQASNPCLWWCCSKCVTKAEATFQPVEEEDVIETSNPQQAVAESSCNQVDLITMISNQFKDFKDELMNSVNEVIEAKVSSVLNQNISDDSTHTQGNISPPISYAGKVQASTSSVPVLHNSSNASVDQVSPGPSSSSIQDSSASPVTKPKLPPADVLVLSPINDSSTTSALAMNNVKKSAEQKLKNVQVDFIRANDKTKKITVGFRNVELRDKGNELLNENGVLTSFGYVSKNGSKMLPKVTLSGVSSEIFDDIGTNGINSEQIKNLQKETVVHKILEKNPSIAQLHSQGHTLSVVYINKVRRERFNQQVEEYAIGLKVSPSIRLAFLDDQQGKAYLGNHRYQVKDRYYIKQCYHCQLIGHTSENCPDAMTNKPAVCMYCMGKHRSSNCTNKINKAVHCCGRCLASKVKNDAENFKTHNAGSPLCPVMCREAKRISENTELASKNVL